MIRTLLLAFALYLAQPELGPVRACVHASQAVAHETRDLPAEIILGIAAVESDFDPRAVSRVRNTASWGFCGVMQTMAASEAECRRQRDLHVAYQTGVRELQKWRRDRRTHGKVRGILLGHGCGNFGVETGRCNGYPERVIAFARRLR